MVFPRVLKHRQRQSLHVHLVARQSFDENFEMISVPTAPPAHYHMAITLRSVHYTFYCVRRLNRHSFRAQRVRRLNRHRLRQHVSLWVGCSR